jgi:hypothetical protein
MGRRDNTLSMVIRQAWDGLPLKTMAKRLPAICLEPHVSIVGHITCHELLKCLSKTDSANGFGNRFLVVCVRRSKLLPEGGRFSEEDTTPLIERLRRAVGYARSAGRLERDDEARQLWRAVYPNLSKGRVGLLGMMTGRAEAQVARLACLYALADCSELIRGEHLRAALEVWRYCFDSARHLFGDQTEDPDANKIRTALQAAGTEGLSRTAMSDLFKHHGTSDAIGRALTLLARYGLARSEIDRSKPGRPVERWFDVPDSQDCEISEETSTGEAPAAARRVSSHISHDTEPDDQSDWGAVR